MDPKALGNLDPKLKETYDRVMGAAPAPGTATPTAAPATPLATPGTQAAPTVAPAAPQPTTANVPSYTADNLKFQAAIQQAPPATGAAAAAPVAGVMPTVQHKTPPLLTSLYIIGAIVFFVVYAYFWAKIFNLPLPF